ncbi:hypothetical protein BGZ83_008620 [Gryganskiella cystojenkinii]|nr:hypothetical protein BGZ83_008620 [Gryganskiella cystojenkinii]
MTQDKFMQRQRLRRGKNTIVLALATAVTLVITAQSLVGQVDAQKLSRQPLVQKQPDLDSDLQFFSQEQQLQQQLPFSPPQPLYQKQQEQQELKDQLLRECERHLATPPAFSNEYQQDSGTTWTTTSNVPPKPRLVGRSDPPVNGTLRLWYRTPAESLAQAGIMIGNGRTQALIGGSINVERLVLSEESNWSGGPGEARNNNQGDEKATDEYRGGNVAPEESVDKQKALQDIKDALREKRSIGPLDPIAKTLKGDERHFGEQEGFGEIIVEELHPFEKVEQYRRELNLETGVLRVQFTSGGILYTREHFCSYPDSVCVMRIQASEPKSVNIKVSLRTDHPGMEFTNVHNRLGIRGQRQSNNITLEAMVAVKTEGTTGVSMANNRQVVVMSFDSATLYYTLGTGWNANGYPAFEDQDPHERLVSALDKAIVAWYNDQYLKHLKDYQDLFLTFQLNFGDPIDNKLPTDELINASRRGKAGEEETYLEVLLLQYSRYLLIASSRPGSLPLSGKTVWNADVDMTGDAPRSGYRMDIELQMNYWLAESTGLGETVTPLIDYMEHLLAPRGRETALLHYGARGWTSHAFSNIWAHTGPTAQQNAFFFPASAAWLCQHAWDRYLYGQDYYFLRDHAYKLMKDATQFWLDTLVKSNDSGALVSSPSYSPEHGPYTEGSALDQQLIWQLFNNTLEAIAVVGEKDKIFVQNLTMAFKDLSSGLKIGSWGQLQEWDLDLDDPNERHWHLAPFWAVYPGHQVFGYDSTTADNTTKAINELELVRAAKEHLRRRGTGQQPKVNYGWAKTWRAALWARLGEGRAAHETLNLFRRANLVSREHLNLVNFKELTGQLGYGAAMVEMLIQNRVPGEIDVLPCTTYPLSSLSSAENGLPETWLVKGGLQGYRTRDGQVVAVAWEEGTVRTIEILANLKAVQNMRIRIRTLGGSEDEGDVGQQTPTDKIHVTTKGSGKPVVFQRVRDAVILPSMSKGQTYVIQIDT